MDEDFDEPFVGGVDSVSDDDDDTSCIGHISTITPLAKPVTDAAVKRGRKPKADSAKIKSPPSLMRPSGAIRISLTPKPKGKRGRPPGSKNKKSPIDSDVKAVKGMITSSSAFPVVEDMKSLPAGPGRPRGRPRLHPPKEMREKKPLGRPRTKVIEGEKAWRAECARLNRIIKKKDELITRYKRRLAEVGLKLDDLPNETADMIDDDDDIANGSNDASQCSLANGQLSMSKPVSDEDDIDLTCRRMEDTHQTYVEMFAKDDCQSDSDENESY